MLGQIVGKNKREKKKTIFEERGFRPGQKGKRRKRRFWAIKGKVTGEKKSSPRKIELQLQSREEESRGEEAPSFKRRKGKDFFNKKGNGEFSRGYSPGSIFCGRRGGENRVQKDDSFSADRRERDDEVHQKGGTGGKTRRPQKRERGFQRGTTKGPVGEEKREPT